MAQVKNEPPSSQPPDNYDPHAAKRQRIAASSGAMTSPISFQPEPTQEVQQPPQPSEQSLVNVGKFGSSKIKYRVDDGPKADKVAAVMGGQHGGGLMDSL